MGVAFTIKGGKHPKYDMDLSQRNAGLLATMMHLDLDPDGHGTVGELNAFACAMMAARIDVLLMQDLSVYEIPTVQSALGVRARMTSFGVDQEYIRRRLGDFYLLFTKAAELGLPVTWS